MPNSVSEGDKKYFENESKMQCKSPSLSCHPVSPGNMPQKGSKKQLERSQPDQKDECKET